MDNIKLILWDIDGTILNFYEAQKNAIRYCFKELDLGICDDNMLNDYDGINHKYWKKLERGEITKKEVLTNRFLEFFTKYNIRTDCIDQFNDLYQVALGDTICFYDNVMDVINKYKDNGIIQFAVTNGTKIAQNKKLSKSGLDKIFNKVFISEDIGYEKPNPRFFDKVLEEANKYNISKEEMVIIGDSLTSDIKLGNNVGIKTIWFNRTNDNIDGYKIDKIITSFKELL